MARDWLKTAREKERLTMKQVANELHISESYYCAIENGTRQQNMDISLAQKLSEALHMPIKQILDAESQRRGHCSIVEGG